MKTRGAGLVAFLLISLSIMALSDVAGAAGPAVNGAFVSWPQPLQTIPLRADSSGHYLAVEGKRDIQIWTLGNRGNLGRILWDARKVYPNSFFLGLDWIGKNLLLSKVDVDKSISLDKIATLQGMPGEYEIPPDTQNAIDTSKSNTICINPTNGRVTPVLSLGYDILRVDSTGRFLAAASRWTEKDDKCNLDFYALGSSLLASKRLIAHFERGIWNRFGNGNLPYLVDWSADSQGIYIVNGRDDWPDVTLLYITRNGQYHEILHRGASVIPITQFEPPLQVMLPHQGLWLGVSHPDKAPSYVIATPHGVISELSGDNLEALLPQNIHFYRALSVTPNGRFLLLQDTSANFGMLLPKQEGDIWLIDTQVRQRRKLTRLKSVGGAILWAGDKILLQFGFSDTPTSYGFLTVPEATLAASSPQLTQLLSREKWESAVLQPSPKSAIAKPTAASPLP